MPQKLRGNVAETFFLRLGMQLCSDFRSILGRYFGFWDVFRSSWHYYQTILLRFSVDFRRIFCRVCEDLRLILGRFAVDFGGIFGLFWIDFG